jgi:PleD family two-component response regulator
MIDNCIAATISPPPLSGSSLMSLASHAAAITGRFPRLATRGALAADPLRPRFSGHVLLVEDDEVNQYVGRRFLERLGCEVTIAPDGRAAVDDCSHATRGSWTEHSPYICLGRALSPARC